MSAGVVNVAVVGTGNISTSHLNAYTTFGERCRIVGLCDIVPAKAEAVKRELGLDEADVVASHEELLTRDDIDLVSVCTPPASHAPITIDLLRAGTSVLVEKPMAPSLRDCDAMIAAARESGALLSVVAQNRFRDDVSAVKEAIDSGLLGPVAHLRVDSAWWRGLPYYDLSWRGTWESEGGGPTLNHAIHHVDLLLWMLGGAPSAVAAMMTNSWHDNSEVEDLSVAVLRYGRALAQLTSSVVHHGERQEIVVQGRDASVSLPWAVTADTSQPNGFPTPEGNQGLVNELQRRHAERTPLTHEGHVGQVEDVLTALETGRPPAISGEDGRQTVEVVTAIYRAAIEQSTVELPIEPASSYYTGDGVLASAPRYFRKTGSVDQLEGSITVGGSGETRS